MTTKSCWNYFREVVIQLHDRFRAEDYDPVEMHCIVLRDVTKM